MAIPTNAAIESELLALLASSPVGRVRACVAYDELAELHPELTVKERTERFKQSASQWANRVQFCRLHLVRRGFIYAANEGSNPEHGIWIITPTGREFQSCLV